LFFVLVDNSLDDGCNGPPIRLESKDKKGFRVERKHAFISTLVKTSVENDDKSDEIPIPGVTANILELVVNYMNEHKGVEPPIIEKPLKSKVMKDNCPHKWDAEYIDKIGDENRQTLYNLILAANYMDIKSLLYLGCAKVASLIKGQPLEKIKEILDPEGKYTNKSAGESDSKDETESAADSGTTTTTSTTAAMSTDAKSKTKSSDDAEMTDVKSKK
jgi:S-phase kinase-associated protein 1